MGRRSLVEGQPCRYGHPWNRDSTWRVCLTCRPPARTKEEWAALHERRAKERREVRARAEQRRAQQAERRAHLAERRREAASQLRAKGDWLKNALDSLRSKEAGDAPSASDLRSLWERQNGRCGLTGMPLEGVVPSLDHIIPRVRGGTNAISNLHFVHPRANYAKHHGTVEEFEAWLLEAARNLEALRLARSLM